MEDRITAQFVQALQLILEKRFEIRLEDALIVKSAKGLTIHADHGHVLVVHHVHRRLQSDFAVIVHPALCNIMEFGQINELRPSPCTVTLPPEYIVSSVGRSLGWVLVYHSDLIVGRLAPAGELLAIDGTEEN